MIRTGLQIPSGLANPVRLGNKSFSAPSPECRNDPKGLQILPGLGDAENGLSAIKHESEKKR